MVLVGSLVVLPPLPWGLVLCEIVLPSALRDRNGTCASSSVSADPDSDEPLEPLPMRPFSASEMRSEVFPWPRPAAPEEEAPRLREERETRWRTTSPSGRASVPITVVTVEVLGERSSMS